MGWGLGRWTAGWLSGVVECSLGCSQAGEPLFLASLGVEEGSNWRWGFWDGSGSISLTSLSVIVLAPWNSVFVCCSVDIVLRSLRAMLLDLPKARTLCTSCPGDPTAIKVFCCYYMTVILLVL